MKSFLTVSFVSAAMVLGFSTSAQASTLEARCSEGKDCLVTIEGDKIKTSEGLEIKTDNIIGWSMVNGTNKGNGVFFKPRNEDYRFFIKYFDQSGSRKLAQISFINFIPSQVLSSALELVSGLAPNHDQSGQATKCTLAGLNSLSGSILMDPSVSPSSLQSFGTDLVGIFGGAVIGNVIGKWMGDPLNPGKTELGLSNQAVFKPAAVGSAIGGTIIYALNHNSGNFLLSKNIMSFTRSKPADSDRFYDASFAHLDDCKDQPLVSPLAIQLSK